MSMNLLTQTVAGMQRRFALNLHRAACEEAPERNVFLSPFSIWFYSMYIVLPKQDSSLRRLHDELTPALWDKIVQPRSANCSGTVYLPRFRIDAGCELSALLSRLGLEAAFSARADFSAMAGSQSPLYFDQVIHKVFVDVNEEGTEAAAATALEMFGGGLQLDPAPPFTMIIDRPFCCAIASRNGAAMFVAAVYNPVEAR